MINNFELKKIKLSIIRQMKFNILMTMLLAICMVFGFTSCEKNKKQQDKEPAPVATLTVENTISLDREYMNLHFGSDYRWYETCVMLKDYMDGDSCDGTVVGVSNIFQFIIPETSQTGALLSAYANGQHVYDKKLGIWVGDFPLNDEEIKLTYKDAYEKAVQANLPKPHSKNCVLRREVGPKPNVNAQYIFGNVTRQIYVDAVTGDVTDKNPAFNGFTEVAKW